MAYNVDNITIEFDCFDNAAFQDDRTTEVVRILRKIADRIEDDGVINADGLRLKDINGNNVGEVSVAYEQTQEYDGEYSGDAVEISGTYGTGNPATIFVLDGWYVVEGSPNVNCVSRHDRGLLVDGVDIETLDDVDTFTTDAIEDTEAFEKEVWEYENN